VPVYPFEANTKFAAIHLCHCSHAGVLKHFAEAGVDVHALAQRLQKDGVDSFVKSWNELVGVIASKGAALT
jgi:transaldolase